MSVLKLQNGFLVQNLCWKLASVFTLSYQPCVDFILVQKYCTLIIVFTKSTPEAARNETDKTQSMFLCWQRERMNECWKNLNAWSFWTLPWPNTHMNETKITLKGFALNILIVEMVNEIWACCFIISPHGFVVPVRYVNIVYLFKTEIVYYYYLWKGNMYLFKYKTEICIIYLRRVFM